MLDWAKIQEGRKVMIEEAEAMCLWELAHALKVPGDVLEFGSYAGTSACVLSLALREEDEGRTLHCFDSFEGLPRGRTGKDSDIVDAGALSLRGSTEQFQRTVKECGAFDVVQIHQGLFKDTLGDVDRIPQIAMVWCDVDRYDSLMDVLGVCWERLAVGGFFVTHDIGVTQTRGVYAALREWGLLDYLTRVGTWLGWVQKTPQLALAIAPPTARQRQDTYDEQSFLEQSVANDPRYSLALPASESGQLLVLSANDITMADLDTSSPVYDLRVDGRFSGYLALTLNEGRAIRQYSLHLKAHAESVRSHLERWLADQTKGGRPFSVGPERTATGVAEKSTVVVDVMAAEGDPRR